MANIAAVFHWSPDVMENMDPEELLEWHHEAMKRVPKTNG